MLWANGFMISDGIEAVPAEGFYLDLEDYEHFEDPGINLLATYEIYHIAEAMPLLKGLMV